MKRIVRLLLVALVAFALPFHAAYGVSMAQGMAVASVSQPGNHAHPGLGKNSGSTDGEHLIHQPVAASGCHEASAAKHESASTDDHAAALEGGSHCGTCTACSTSVGMIVSATAMAPYRGYDAQVPSPSHPLRGIAPIPLDKPPLAA